MIRTHQYRLYPNQAQAVMLDYLLWQGRKIYNAALEQRITLWEEKQERISLYDQRDHFCAMRWEEPDTFGLLPYDTIDDLIRRLDKSFKAFFRRLKAGETPGFPRFKGRYRFRSLGYKNSSGCKLLFDENREDRAWLRLMNVGEVKMILHRPLPADARVKYVMVKRNKRDQWYANVQLETPDTEAPRHPGPAIGIDVGMHWLLALSDGERVPNPRWYRDGKQKRKRLNRQLARRQKNDKNGKPVRADLQSQNWRDTRRAIANHAGDTTSRRHWFWHNMTDRLTKEYSLIALENLTLDFMIQNRHLAMSAHDAAFSTFWQMLEYKAEQTGTKIVYVNPAYTSQRCSGALPDGEACNKIVKKDLSVRVHKCVSCGLEIDRDVNAARNILNLALQAPELGAQDLT